MRDRAALRALQDVIPSLPGISCNLSRFFWKVFRAYLLQAKKSWPSFIFALPCGNLLSKRCPGSVRSCLLSLRHADRRRWRTLPTGRGGIPRTAVLLRALGRHHMCGRSGKEAWLVFEAEDRTGRTSRPKGAEPSLDSARRPPAVA